MKNNVVLTEMRVSIFVGHDLLMNLKVSYFSTPLCKREILSCR